MLTLAAIPRCSRPDLLRPRGQSRHSPLKKTMYGSSGRAHLESYGAASLVKKLLQQALRLKGQRKEFAPTAYQQQIEQLNAALTHHLRNRILRNDDNPRLLNGIGLQRDEENSVPAR